MRQNRNRDFSRWWIFYKSRLYSFVVSVIFISYFLTPFLVNAQSEPYYSFALGLEATGVSMDVDNAGNIYRTGYFSGSVDFDPGIGVSNLTSIGGQDIFVQKLDPFGSLIWVKSFGSTSNDNGNSIKVDANGNVYITGAFSGTVDFDPAAGITNLSSVGSGDVFVLKLNSGGNLVWARSMGGTSSDSGNGITVDASFNVITVGFYQLTADFDPGVGTHNLTSNGQTDYFVQKLSSTGGLLWVESMGGSLSDNCNSVAVDLIGNVYVTGYFSGTVDFDPNSGVTNISSNGDVDIFIQKFLYATGSLTWIKTIGGTTGDTGEAIAVDGSGNVLTTGRFRGTVDFDPGASTTNLNLGSTANIFISKLDASGSFVFAKAMGGNMGDDSGNDIEVDIFGSIYSTGIFFGTVDFDPGSGTTSLTSSGSTDIYIQKLDNSGNLVWVKSMGGNDTGFVDRGNSLTVDPFRNIYSIGIFNTTADFDPGAGTANLTSPASVSDYVLKWIQLSFSSDIIVNSGFGYSSNIGYSTLSNQSANLSSTLGTEVGQFTLRDGSGSNDLDLLNTTLTSITISVTNPSNIRRAALYDGATEIGEVAGGAALSFTGINLVANDNSTKLFSLRVSYSSVVSDNTQNTFAIIAVTAAASGSEFATSNGGGALTSNTGDRNRIEVIATKLKFVQQPSNTFNYEPMSPPISVEAVDALNNRDMDFSATVGLNGGGLFSTPLASLVSGFGVYSDAIFSGASVGNGVLTSNSSGLTNASSSSFDIFPQSAISDIITNSSFSYSQNINYLLPANQTSDITSSTGVEIGQFLIRDGGLSGDADNSPTAINSISVTLTNPSIIRRIALYEGSIELDEQSGAATVDFIPFGVNVNIPLLMADDNSSRQFSIRVSYNSVVTDNIQNQVTISGIGPLMASSIISSGFSSATGASSSLAGDINRIEVAASKISITTQPPAIAIVGVNITPLISADALDALNNKDVDYSSSVAITNSSSLGMLNLPNSFSSGSLNFSANFQFTTFGSASLTISSGSLINSVSNLILVRAAEPTLQALNLSFSNISTNSMDGSFITSSVSPTGYIILRREGSSPTEVPLDGNTYSVNDILGLSTVVGNGSSLNFNSIGMLPGVVYYYDIFAFNGNGMSINYLISNPLEGFQVTRTIPPTLAIPSLVGESSFQLSWAAVTGATDYALDISTDNFSTLVSGYSNKLLGNVTSTSVTGLSNGTTYQSRIRAINSAGASINSNQQTALTKPAAPVLTSVTNITSNSFDVNWNVVFGASEFLLDVSSDNFTNQIAGYNGLTVFGTSYQIIGLNPSTTYQIRLRSKNNSGNSLYSNTLTAITLATAPIAQATSLTFSSVTANSMSGAFTTATGTPTGYLVLYKPNSSPSDIPVDGVAYATGGIIGTSTIANVGSSNTFSLTVLNPNTVYYFDVFSYNGATDTYNYLVTSPLEGSRATLGIEPISQPTGITFGNISVSAVDVAFTAAALSPTGYLVLRKAGSASTEIPVDGVEYGIGNLLGTSTVVYTQSGTSFTDSGLGSGTTYFYTVFAFNGSTNTYNYLTSTPLQGNVITKPSAPIALDATNVISGSFKAKWNASTGAASYELDVATTQDFSTFLAGYSSKSITATEDQLTNLSPAQTNYWYRVRSINASGKSTNSNVISLTTPAVTNPAALVISSPVVTGLKISTTLSGGSGARAVKFFSKGILAPASAFMEKTLTSTTDTYEVTVTAADFDELGLEYYFTASDASTTTFIRSPSSRNGFISRSIAKDEKSIPNLSSGGKLENYRIISVPYKLEDNLVSSIFGGFGDHKFDWRLMHYEGGKNKDYPAFPRIEQGKGYWFNTIKDPVIKIGAGSAPEHNKDNPFTLSLAKEWNQIGNPFPFDIKWSAVLANNPGVAVGKLKVYDPASATLKESDELKMWSGGFVLADNAASITFPISLKNARVSEGSIASKLDESEWFVPLTLTHGVGENSEIGFGMHPEALDGKDRFDDVAVPRFFNYLEFTTQHDEFFVPHFGRDVVPTSEQYAWSFVMNSNLKGEKALLRWDPEAFGTNAAQLLLFDVEEQVFIKMRSVNHYSFTYRDNRSFKFIYSLDGRTLEPDFTMLGKPYPNPSSRQVTVPVAVKANQTQMIIEVIDLLGKKVKVIAQREFSAGMHNLTWSCDDEQSNKVGAGIYLIQMKQSNGNSQTQKVVVR